MMALTNRNFICEGIFLKLRNSPEHISEKRHWHDRKGAKATC